MVYNAGLYALAGYAILGSGPLAIFAGVLSLGVSAVGLIQIWDAWPKMDSVNKTLTVLHVISFIIFGRALRSSVAVDPTLPSTPHTPRGIYGTNTGLVRGIINAYKAQMKNITSESGATRIPPAYFTGFSRIQHIMPG